MTATDTNASSEEQAVIEALAVWACNRQSRYYRDNGGAASWFHECLPATQENFREWAKDALGLIAKIRGVR